MTESTKLLPLGSIVILKEGLQKLMIVGRGAVYGDSETGEEKFADYMAVIYPSGIDPETTIFFNQSDIDKVIFKGFSDEEEIRFLDIYAKWKQENYPDEE
ncbi:DUF4176 domain-containing protein [Fructilactobacillus carniphilus]|uniref:DUF4176 domain-containing protein n=1 Tax=Fructilactobacillus carniphilus TaxID=2940297 RepID=A0ABY5BUW6_9LACO|nr:DUF4176 domain-containing protein [Fructilactobacillus carniphilus]USS90290.1 DUF4176 domain-containing protein [Fructilactobacillus carniphilus]